MRLPNFLIIGAAKGGTTSLYHYLRQHPNVFMSPVKEVRYFCCDEFPAWDATIRTASAYASLFAGADASHLAIGEASPQYLNSAVAADRIADELPGVRLIVLLRNPVDRSYSSYLGQLRGGLERRAPAVAIRPGTYCFETSLFYPRLVRYLKRFERDRI